MLCKEALKSAYRRARVEAALMEPQQWIKLNKASEQAWQCCLYRRVGVSRSEVVVVIVVVIEAWLSQSKGFSVGVTSFRSPTGVVACTPAVSDNSAVFSRLCRRFESKSGMSEKLCGIKPSKPSKPFAHTVTTLGCTEHV